MTTTPSDENLLEAPAPLVEQLWAPGIRSGALRVSRAGHTRPAAPASDRWATVEQYFAVPSVAEASILLPTEPRRALAGALLNYRALRSWRTGMQRWVLGTTVRAGVPLPLAQVVVEMAVDGRSNERAHPLGEIGHALGRSDLRAAIGVRRGANRKATLQLVDTVGRPAGFAKMAWDPASAHAVRTEIRALTSFHAGEGQAAAQAPRVLATGSYFGQPYLVTSPLPLGCRAVRREVPPPTPQEIAALGPVTRRAPIKETAHWRALGERLVTELERSTSDFPAEGVLHLSKRIDDLDLPVPVVERWHGDLSPWNTARGDDGRLWCWDWESSEPDAAAGLDVLHWHLSVARENGVRQNEAALRAAFAAATPAFLAFGIPRAAWPHVAGLYVVVLVERALALAAGQGGWEDAWLAQDQLSELVAAANRMLELR